MRLRFAISRPAFVLGGTLLLAVPAVHGQAASTNSADMKLQSLDDTFGKPFGSFKQPLHDDVFTEPMVVNVPQPYIDSRKARDLMDKNENWSFLTPSDYNEQKTIEEAIGAPSTDPNATGERKSALDRFNEQGIRGGLVETNRAGNASSNNHDQDQEDSDEPVTAGKLGKPDKGDSADASGLDGLKMAARESKFDTGSKVFATPESTWGFSEVFGGKETTDKQDKGDKDHETETLRAADSDKDLFQRLQSGPTFSAIPDVNSSSSGPSTFGSLQNILDTDQSSGGSSALQDAPAVNVSSDITPAATPGMAPLSDVHSMPDEPIAPAAPGEALATPADAGQLDISRYANPQPVYNPPKRPF